jgi:hypothetical protein
MESSLHHIIVTAKFLLLVKISKGTRSQQLDHKEHLSERHLSQSPADQSLISVVTIQETVVDKKFVQRQRLSNGGLCNFSELGPVTGMLKC